MLPAALNPGRRPPGTATSAKGAGTDYPAHEQQQRGDANDQHEHDDEDGEDDDDNGEEEEEEDPTQTIVDMGRHARMQRIQKVLFDQLVGNDERITLELREREEELRGVKQVREDIGVSLYGVQQQLAQLQMALEVSHRKLTTIHDERFASEDQLDDWKENLSQKKLQVQKNKSHLYKTQSELDSLNSTLRQVEKYNEEMKNEIARTQRAAQKAEETMTNMEKDKVKQDLYIDSLNEQIKSLQEKIAMTIAQHKSQKLETAAAEETLREATAQMETIAFEKKQLLQQWKSSLIGMQQRDQALQATQTAISTVNEEDLALASEIRGYKQSIEKTQAQHETLVGMIERFNAEIRFVEEQIASLRQEHDRLSERYDMLTKSLRQTEAETAKVSGETKKLELDTTQVQQHLETTQRERHGLEDQISAQKNEQTTVNKAAHNLTKEAQRIQGVVHEKEIALANLKNEMARVSVDILNVQAHASQLEETQEKLVAELKQEDVQVEKLELEIRQRNDEIEKKMLRLDRLNKKYEQLLSKMEDENTGPLEAMIKNLTKETSNVRVQNLDKQKEWLHTQTALVNLSAESQELGEKNQELKSKTSVLEQKQLRLLNDFDKMRKDIKELKASINGMHNDTVKLNELIAKNSSRQEELLNMNHGLEMEFKRELKDLEAEAIQMEQLAATLKSEKQDILDRIVEVERQIMLWEKKIQLEKETQAALDPEVGQAEAKSMEKEIHRMRLRLEALQRSQEQMLQDMEQAIHKRDLIAMRGRSKKDTELTYASLTTKVSTLQNNLRKTEKDTVKMDKTIKQKMVSCEDISFQLEKATAELKVDEERGMSLQKGINNALYVKQRYIDAEARKLRLAKRFESMRKSAPSSSQQDDTKARDELEKSQRAVEKIKQIVQKLQQQSPHLNEVLSRVLMLADEPPL
uniref:Coiled-coil domain-containing protein 40 n=1 Tax=Globisporangium ultimum (strain ATCC 200006 / CBS 805.95 / DAOM BR144) TaxID=431595 RepID=K3WH79_GLOUD